MAVKTFIYKKNESGIPIMWEEFIQSLISTILGVVIGGLITIKVSNITNTALLRKQHTLEILQKIKELLRAWSEQRLLDVTAFLECNDISDFKAITQCDELRLLIVYFDTNISVLSTLKSKFDALRHHEIKIQLKADKLKKELISLSEKYHSTNPGNLYKYTEVSQVLEENTVELFKLHTNVEELIAEIDSHINNDILK